MEFDKGEESGIEGFGGMIKFLNGSLFKVLKQVQEPRLRMDGVHMGGFSFIKRVVFGKSPPAGERFHRVSS